MLATLALLLLTGLTAGFLAGLLGIGGGLVIVPALTWLLMHQGAGADVAVPTAVATSLGSMLLTSASSITAHHRLGGIDWACARRLGLGVAIGALLGATLAVAVSGPTLARIFAVVAALIGFRMLLGQPRKARPYPGESHGPAYPFGWWIMGPAIGAVSAMVGIGGGSFNVPYLARNGYVMARAVAIAAVCGFPIALAGSLGFMMLGPGASDWPHTIGYWYWPGVLVLGVAGVVSAPSGARLAHRLPAHVLRRLFGAFLILIALRMAI